MVASASPRA
jgi:REP element-mobilizing transposase RayT